MGTPNQKTLSVPLIPILVVDETFSKVVIDCIDPLTDTKAGNQNVLSCVSTRFKKVISLRRVPAKVL